jgi:hypothetical protein
LFERLLNQVGMTKSVFLILVHANSGQLKRLIDKVGADNSIIYLQVDLKTDISLFEEYHHYSNVIFIKHRIKIAWGGYSQVQGMVNSFKEIIPSLQDDQYVSVISGQDYPIMRNEEMNNFLSNHQGKAFMEYYLIHEEWKAGVKRLERYDFSDFNFPGMATLEIKMNAWLPKRKPPKELIYVGKSSWFTITVEHIKYIVDFLEKNHAIKKYFKLTWGSDELVFQTILYNSKYKEQMVNNNLRYIDWSQGKARPKVLDISDAENLRKSGKFFARKFDEKVDSKILDWIDANLLIEKAI